MAKFTVMAWHFLRPDGRLRDGTEPPPDGKWLEHGGPIVPCQSGLHASICAIDALFYAPGPIVCRVECAGVHHDDDKLACRRRRILWRADGTDTLRLFVRRQAQSVLHLWSAPPVVRDYLESGDESIRDAVRDAAWAAVRGAAWAAARDDAWAAVWAAVLAANAAVWAASVAARDAALEAMWAAQRSAEWADVRDAAWADANDMLTEMLMRLEVRRG